MLTHYADAVPLGASVQPLRDTDSIVWTIKFRNGNMKRFKFPIRTIPEDSADPSAGIPDPDTSKFNDPNTLFTQNAHAFDASQFSAS